MEREVKEQAEEPAKAGEGARQLIFRQERATPFEERDVEGYRFHYLEGAVELLRLQRGARRVFGEVGFGKALAKLATRKRDLYLFEAGGRVAHYGWINIGFCSHYPVEDRGVVIGPIWSEKNCRGRGLATEGLKRAMNVMLRRGYSIFYIDTADDNVPCRGAIAKASFPESETFYARGR